MRSSCFKFLTATVVGVALFSCGKEGEKGQTSQILSITSSQFEPRIGESYNEYTNAYMSQSCITHDPSQLEFVPPQVGNLVYTQNASFDQITNTFSGSGEVKLDIAAVKADGKVKFANEMQNTKYSTSVMISLDVTGGEVALPQQIRAGSQAPVLNDLGRRAVQEGTADDKMKLCGTKFVSRKKLMANFVAVMKFEFENKGQADNFKGQLSVNLPSGISGSAELELAMSKANDNANLTLKVMQLGGDASRLSGVLSENLVECNAKNREACKKAIQDILVYVKNDFSNQFRNANNQTDPGRYVTVGVDYAPYTAVTEAWLGRAPSPEMMKALNLTRRDFGEKLLDEEANWFRAQSLIRSGIKLSPNQLEELRGIQSVVTDRMKVYADAAQDCYKISEDYRPCEAAIKTAKTQIHNAVYFYDINKLVIIPDNMGGWCAKLKQWYAVRKEATGGEAVASTILSDEELYTLSHVLTVLLPGENYTFDLAAPSGTKTLDQLSCHTLVRKVVEVSTIELTNKRLQNIDPLVSFKFVQNVNLSKNFIEDAFALSKLRYLSQVDLTDSHVRSIKGLNLGPLRVLLLRNNSLTNNGYGTSAEVIFNEISGAGALEFLDLSNNKSLRSMDALTNLPSLTKLQVSDTKVGEEEVKKMANRKPLDFPSLSQIVLLSSQIRNCENLRLPNGVTLQCD